MAISRFARRALSMISLIGVVRVFMREGVPWQRELCQSAERRATDAHI